MTKESFWKNKTVRGIAAALFWLAVWQLASALVGRGVLLASPLEALKALYGLVGTRLFWSSVLTTFGRIFAGFMLAVIVGVLLAAASSKFSLARTLITPLATVIKATPVVSFIILALIWINSRHLSTFISFLMVLPIIYISTLSGIDGADKKLLEAARVFRTKRGDKIRYIYMPAALPSFISGASVGLGLCWKSGVAAEVIGLPAGTLGERLYEAKLYLNTAELFAYTIVIILISAAFERLFLLAVKRLSSNLQKEARV